MSQQLEIEKCKLKTTKAQQVDCLENVPHTMGENFITGMGLAGVALISYALMNGLIRFLKNRL